MRDFASLLITALFVGAWWLVLLCVYDRFTPIVQGLLIGASTSVVCIVTLFSNAWRTERFSPQRFDFQNTIRVATVRGALVAVLVFVVRYLRGHEETIRMALLIAFASVVLYRGIEAGKSLRAFALVLSSLGALVLGYLGAHAGIRGGYIAAYILLTVAALLYYWLYPKESRKSE